MAEANDPGALTQQFHKTTIELELLAEELTNKIKTIKSWHNQDHQLTHAAAETHLEHVTSLIDKYSNGYFKFRTLASLHKLTESEKVKVAEVKGEHEALSPDGLDCVMWLKQQMEDAQSQATRDAARAESPRMPFRLPELKITPFESNESDILAFSKFSAAFHDALVCHPNLTEEQRLLFLRTLLQGEALSLVAGQTTFRKAWCLLKQKYLDQPKIINVMLNHFTDPSPLTSIRKIADHVSQLRFKLSELEAQGLPMEDSGLASHLAGKLLRNRLPGYINQELARRTNTGYPHLNQMLSCMDDVLKMFEPQAHSSHASAKKPSQSAATRPKAHTYASIANSSAVKPSVVAAVAAPPSSPDSPVRPSGILTKNCKFCSKEHISSKCEKFKTLKQRTDRAGELGLCSKCLSSGHTKKDCKNHPFPFPCSECRSSQHIRPFCPKENKS